MYARLLLPVGLLLLTACGGGDGDRLGTEGPAAAASAPVEAPASPRAGSGAGQDGASQGGASQGVVRDASGDPVAGVMVSAVSLATPRQAVPELAVMSDRDGRYSWPAVLSPGPYELRAETPDGPAVARVQVRPDTSASVDLRAR